MWRHRRQDVGSNVRPLLRGVGPMFEPEEFIVTIAVPARDVTDRPNVTTTTDRPAQAVANYAVIQVHPATRQPSGLGLGANAEYQHVGRDPAAV